KSGSQLLIVCRLPALPPSAPTGRAAPLKPPIAFSGKRARLKKPGPFFQNLQMWGDTVPKDTLLLDNTGPEILTISGSNQVQPSHTANSDHFGRLKGRADKARAFFLHSVCSRNLYCLCTQFVLVKRQLR